MSLPNVNITLADGQLGGTIATADGIAGMVLTGASAGTIVAGTPFLVTSLTSAVTLGLAANTNPFAYKQVSEFYNEAPVGSQLYLLLVANTMKVNQIADKTNASGAIKLLNFAAGAIKILGIATDDTAVYDGTINIISTTHGINEDCYTAITNLESMADDFFTAQKPFRAMVGGTSSTGSATTLTDQSTNTKNRISLFVGDTVSGAGVALGLILGRGASIPVQRKFSRVKDGSLATSTAFIGTTPADQFTMTSTIHDKHIITFRIFPNKSGFYFTGDWTCTDSTDDYSSFARGRVIDKAQILAYATFVEEVDDEVPVNTDGTINTGYIKYLEQGIVNQINATMTAGNEISGVSCFIDPSQNVLSTGILTIVLKVTPVGYASDIEVQLGFINPANG